MPALLQAGNSSSSSDSCIPQGWVAPRKPVPPSRPAREPEGRKQTLCLTTVLKQSSVSTSRALLTPQTGSDHAWVVITSVITLLS